MRAVLLMSILGLFGCLARTEDSEESVAVTQQRMTYDTTPKPIPSAYLKLKTTSNLPTCVARVRTPPRARAAIMNARVRHPDLRAPDTFATPPIADGSRRGGSQRQDSRRCRPFERNSENARAAWARDRVRGQRNLQSNCRAEISGNHVTGDARASRVHAGFGHGQCGRIAAFQACPRPRPQQRKQSCRVSRRCERRPLFPGIVKIAVRLALVLAMSALGTRTRSKISHSPR